MLFHILDIRPRVTSPYLRQPSYWRKRQDSNLHRVAPERFSRPRQYQLCLLFHGGGEGGIRTLARFYPPNPLAGGPLWPLGYLAIKYKKL